MVESRQALRLCPPTEPLHVLVWLQAAQMAAHQPAPAHVHTAALRKLLSGLHAKEEPLLQ